MNPLYYLLLRFSLLAASRRRGRRLLCLAAWMLPLWLATGQAHGQTLPWQQAEKFTGNGDIFAVAHDAAGDEYVAGNFTGNLTIGSFTLVPKGSGQVFIAKRSAAGTWLWARRAGTNLTSGGNDIGYRLAVLGSGATAQVFLSGRYMTGTGNTADFGPFTLTGYASTATADIFVAALDGNGTWLWVQRAGSAGGHDFAPGLAVTGSGTSAQVFITGYCSTSTTVPMQFGTISLPGYSTSIGNDLFVASLDAAGNWLWARRAGSNQGTAGTADEMSDNLVVTGSGATARVFMFGTYYASTSSTAEFGPFTLAGYSPTGSPDLFVAALDVNGNWLWARRAGGTGFDFCYGATGTGSGATTRLYTTGSYTASTSTTAAFGSLGLAGYGGGNDIDAYVAALDGNGNWLWTKRLGSSNGEDDAWNVAVAGRGPSARLYVTGWYTASLSTTADIGGNALAGFGATATSAAFVAKLDTAGNWGAAQRAGGTGGAQLHDVTVTPLGCVDRVTVVGGFSNSLAAGTTTLTGNGQTPWVGVLNPVLGSSSTADAGSNRSTCAGTPVVLGPATPLPGATYSWSPATGLSSPTVANPTVTLPNTTGTPLTQSYTLVVTTAAGCVQTGTVVVTVNPVPVAGTITGPAAVCDASQPQTYRVTGAAGVTYQWTVTGGTLTTGQGTAQVSVQFTPGAPTYALQVVPTSAAGCVGTAGQLALRVDTSQPTLTVASVASTDNTRIELNPTVTGSGGTTVQVLRRVAGQGSFGLVGTVPATATSFTDTGVDAAAASYEYRLDLTNACGTLLSSAVVRSIRLEATVVAGTGGANQGQVRLQWNAYVGFPVQAYELYRSLEGGPFQLQTTLPGTVLQATSLNRNATSPTTGAGFRQEFRVVAVAATGLRANSNTIRADFANPLVLYNIITPNGDAQNDLFVIDNIGLYPGNALRIYNRWGREVFTTVNYQNDWGGSADVAPGIYYYLLTLPAGSAFKGWVEVVK